MIQVIAASENYDKVFESRDKSCPPLPQKNPDGKYVFSFGGEKFILYEKNTRGDEYGKSIDLFYLLKMHRGLIYLKGKKGTDLYPDFIQFNASYEYEFHPYISRMTEKVSYRNKVPTFMVNLVSQDLGIDSLTNYGP